MNLFLEVEKVADWLVTVIRTMWEIETEESQHRAMCSPLQVQLLVGERGCNLWLHYLQK